MSFLLLSAIIPPIIVTPTGLILTVPAPAAVFGPKPIGFTASYTPSVDFTASFTPSIGFEKVG